MLDDLNVLAQKDPQNALGVVAEQPKQLDFIIPNIPKADIKNVVFAGMGGSALAAQVVKNWLGDTLPVSFEIVRGYALPGYVGSHTLVIVDSYSGNTEEELAILTKAEELGAQIIVIASGGRLEKLSERQHHAFIELPDGYQPRLAVWYGIKAITQVLDQLGIISNVVNELEEAKEFLELSTKEWVRETATEKNYAKQLAEKLMGKTTFVYAGPILASAAYKWKININENAKTVAAWNELPEFNHNEFQGWVSHPVEKPFAVVELQSNLDHPQVQKRFEVSNKLLSGKMPHPIIINAKGESHIAQLLWAILLGDFVSVYLAILHGVNPTSVDLIEKLKQELA